MKSFLFPILALAVLPTICHSAVYSITGASTYTQNFDTLAASGTPAWANDGTIPSWYAERGTGGGFTVYTPSTGSSSSGLLYSFGTGTDAERALGSVSSGTPANIAYGFAATNSSGSSIAVTNLSYTGEQWRNGGNTSSQPLTVWYQVSSAPFTALTPASNTGWTQVSTLTFNTPTNAVTAAALDGNLAANQASLSDATGIILAPGEFVMIRWLDINDAGNDHGVSVDNLSITYAVVPEPSAVALGAVGVLGLLRRRR